MNIKDVGGISGRAVACVPPDQLVRILDDKQVRCTRGKLRIVHYTT